MATMNLLPPAGPTLGTNPCTVNGRTYSCAVGSVLSNVPDFDGLVLKANGWIPTASTAGATSARPVNPKVGTVFYDSTLGYNVIYQGNGVWAHHATGAGS